MARSETSKLTWPVPWWVLAVPALIVAALTAWYISRASGWAYVSLPRLSGQPRESGIITGPLVCVCAAWIAERFTNRRSPIAWPIAPRASGALGRRVLLVLVATLVAAQLLGAVPALAYQYSRALGGEFFPIEVLAASLDLTFFTATGFLIGTVIARWWAPLAAVLWAGFWIYIAPIAYTITFPDRGTNIEYFMFPATVGQDHRSLSTPVMVAVIVWWALVLTTIVTTTVGWHRFLARKGAKLLTVAGLATAAATGMGFSASTLLPSPFIDGATSDVVCTPLDQTQVCLAVEQMPMLEEIRARAQPVLDRLGEVPPGIEAIASSRAITTLTAQGRPATAFIRISVSTYGARTIEFDVGVGFGGLAACVPTADTVPGTDQPVIAPDGVNWAFAIGHWLAQDPESDPEHQPLERKLADTDPSTVRAWYAKNAQTILSCAYAGDGP